LLSNPRIFVRVSINYIASLPRVQESNCLKDFFDSIFPYRHETLTPLNEVSMMTH